MRAYCYRYGAWARGLTQVLACLAGGFVMGEPANPVVLESECIRLVIGTDPVPHIAALRHRGSGIAVIPEAADPSSLFLVALRKADGTTESLVSRQAGRATVSLTAAGKGSTAVMTFSDFPGTALRVETRVTLDRDPALSVWSIRIDNPEQRPIASVRFPWLYAAPRIGESGADDVIVLPAYPGALAVDPGRNWGVNGGKELAYPGDLAAQFVAYQDRDAGLFLASRDGDSLPRKLAVWRRADRFEFYHDYLLGDAAPEAWACPYPTVVGVTQGTWYDSADVYKRWAREQSWCVIPLAQREDVPAWYKQGPLVHVCAVRTFGSDQALSGSYYPKLLAHLQYLRQKVDGPIMAMLASWENHRRWTGGDYFPIFDHDCAVETIAQLRAEAFRPFFFLSGLFFTFENVGVDGGIIRAADQHLDSYVIDRGTGKPVVYTLNESSGRSEWSRKSYEICAATPFAKAFFRSVIDQTHAAGVEVLQMDQTTAGGGHACYATGHNHAPGPGPYQTREFHALLDDMRAYGKAKTPDFALFHEEPHEELIPHLDGFHMREYKERWWYRALPGVVGIPLFTYLYHEYALGYGGDNAPLGPGNPAWSTRCHAVNLVSGKTPGASVWSSPSQLFESHAAPLTMLRNHCQLLKTRAARYLMLGTMLHPYALDVPAVTYHVWTTTGGKGHAEDFAEPSVLTSSWQDADGNIAHLFVNPGDVARTLSVALDTRNAPAFGECDVDVYGSAAAERGLLPWRRSVTLPQAFTAELSPQQLVFIEVRPAGAAAAP